VDKVIESHGSIRTATCSKCLRKCDDMFEFWQTVKEGAVPTCNICGGIQQPDVVLFGQGLPSSFFDHLSDLRECDLLIVMGTSLKVYPFAGLVNSVPDSTPRLLFNNEPVGAFTKGNLVKLEENVFVELKPGREGTYRDIGVIGDIDKGVGKFMELCGWV